MTDCVMCARPATDGHACGRCVATVIGQLEMCAWLGGQLRVTLTRQDRVARGGGHRSSAAGSPLGYHAGARLALDRLLNALITWARDLNSGAGRRPLVEVLGRDPSPAVVAAWLMTADVRHHPAVDELSADLQREIEQALETINPDGDQTFGVCGADVEGVPCPAYLYGDATASWVRCSRCDTQHDTRKRITSMEQRARVLYFRAATLARLLPLLLERPVSASNIRNWYAEGRPISTQYDAEGHITYRCGDVIDVAKETPKRNRPTKGSAA